MKSLIIGSLVAFMSLSAFGFGNTDIGSMEDLPNPFASTRPFAPNELYFPAGRALNFYRTEHSSVPTGRDSRIAAREMGPFVRYGEVINGRTRVVHLKDYLSYFSIKKYWIDIKNVRRLDGNREHLQEMFKVTIPGDVYAGSRPYEKLYFDAYDIYPEEETSTGFDIYIQISSTIENGRMQVFHLGSSSYDVLGWVNLEDLRKK